MASGASDRTINCPTCGRVLPADARFCGFDGTNLKPIAAPTGPLPSVGAAKLCPLCKKIYPPYASFCAHDRSALLSVSSENPTMSHNSLPAQTAPQAAVQAAAQQQQQQPQQPPPANQAVDPEEEDSAYANLIGKTIEGKYLVQSVLGEGGMAVVYRAYHKAMDRTVVIKVMQGWLLSNRNSVERFERECKLTAKLAHPNIITVYDVGAINNKEPYLVMEYIKGEALADKIGRQGALPVATAANIMIQICRGLQEAHSIGIIHRDLKPDNVLLQDKSDRPDWVKIVDFGISNLVHGSKRLTKTGRMVGTPEYIAPEQLKDKPIDIRTDIYSLGIMMFEMLTGRVPFEGESAEAILMKHLLEEPPPMAECREDKQSTPFDEIVSKCLHKNPDERYQTATELRLDVEQALSKVLLKRKEGAAER